MQPQEVARGGLLKMMAQPLRLCHFSGGGVAQDERRSIHSTRRITSDEFYLLKPLKARGEHSCSDECPVGALALWCASRRIAE